LAGGRLACRQPRIMGGATLARALRIDARLAAFM
jgi:hypothetical protein